MTTWRLWPSTSGGSLTADAATTDLGVQFQVTTSGLALNGYYFWLPASGSTVAITFRLWTTANGTSGTLVTNSAVTSGTLTAGQWNFTALSPSVALATGTVYVASATYTGAGNHYGATTSYWTTGGGGASGVTNGPLTAPNAASALGTAQGCFNEPSTAGFPATASGNQANYWVDVSVTDGLAAAGLPQQPQPGGRTWRRRHRRRQVLPRPPRMAATWTPAAALAGSGTLAAGTVTQPAIPGNLTPGAAVPGAAGGAGLVTQGVPWSSSGPRAPGTGTGLSGGTGTWINPGNITADDGSAATWTVI